jgi:hypothetical protein
MMAKRNEVISNKLFKDAIDTWHNIYLELTQTKYVFLAKDVANLKNILRTIRNRLRSNDRPSDDTMLLEAFEAFIRAVIALNDRWILDNFEISIVYSKFNVLYEKIKRKQASSSKHINSGYYETRYGTNGN